MSLNYLLEIGIIQYYRKATLIDEILPSTVVAYSLFDQMQQSYAILFAQLDANEKEKQKTLLKKIIDSLKPVTVKEHVLHKFSEGFDLINCYQDCPIIFFGEEDYSFFDNVSSRMIRMYHLKALLANTNFKKEVWNAIKFLSK